MSLKELSGEVKYYEGFKREYKKITYCGWCVIHGKVVDYCAEREMMTRKDADILAVTGRVPPHMEYIGTEIPRKLLENLLEERKEYLPVISMYDTVYGDLGTGTLSEVIL